MVMMSRFKLIENFDEAIISGLFLYGKLVDKNLNFLWPSKIINKNKIKFGETAILITLRDLNNF